MRPDTGNLFYGVGRLKNKWMLWVRAASKLKNNEEKEEGEKSELKNQWWRSPHPTSMGPLSHSLWGPAKILMIIQRRREEGGERPKKKDETCGIKCRSQKNLCQLRHHNVVAKSTYATPQGKVSFGQMSQAPGRNSYGRILLGSPDAVYRGDGQVEGDGE